MKFPIRKLILFFLLIISNFLFSQDLASVYKQHDQSINYKNTDLSYGPLFIEKYKKIDGNHNYFLSNDFLTSSIEYKGQKYYDIKIKYDLIDDEVIVKILETKNNFVLVLEKKFITFFKIKDHNFINNEQNGFLERLFIGKKTTLYKKHYKRAKKELDQNFIHYSFIKKEQYFIYINDEFLRVKSKKDFIKIFPKHKSIINNFYQKEKVLIKENEDIFLSQLMKKIN